MSGQGQSMVIPVMTNAHLFAQGRVANLGDRFRNGGEMEWMTMFYVIVALAAAIAVVWLVSRHLSVKEAGGYHNHYSLFRELCRAHQLGLSDRRLLAAMARAQGVVVPARLFVEPDRFDAERLATLREAQRSRAAKLYETLFRADTDSTA